MCRAPPLSRPAKWPARLRPGRSGDGESHGKPADLTRCAASPGLCPPVAVLDGDHPRGSAQPIPLRPNPRGGDRQPQLSERETLAPLSRGSRGFLGRVSCLGRWVPPPGWHAALLSPPPPRRPRRPMGRSPGGGGWALCFPPTSKPPGWSGRRGRLGRLQPCEKQPQRSRTVPRVREIRHKHPSVAGGCARPGGRAARLLRGPCPSLAPRLLWDSPPPPPALAL